MYAKHSIPDPDTLKGQSERDPDTALLLFHEAGGLWRFNQQLPDSDNQPCPVGLQNELKAEALTPEAMSELIQRFQQRVGNDTNLLACAACGRKRIITCHDEEYEFVSVDEEHLRILMLSSEQEDAYNNLRQYRKAASVWPDVESDQMPAGAHRYWLHPELVQSSTEHQDGQIGIELFQTISF